MAEGLAIRTGRALGRFIEARSASTLGLVDHPADPHAVAVCADLDVDISEHRSRPVFAADVAWADHILVMSLHHAAYVRDAHPEADRKVLMLGTLGGLLDIADPLGSSRARFAACRDQIDRCITAFVSRLPK